MLTTKRPTSTTIQYTVSTYSPALALPGRALEIIQLLGRVVVAALVATCLALESNAYLHFSPLTLVQVWDAILPLYSLPIAFWRTAIYVTLTFLVLRRPYATESLLVIQGLGVQTSTSSGSYLWSSSTRFIPTAKVQDVFIHEAFRGFEVRFYLSIVVQGEEAVVVVFPVSGDEKMACQWNGC